MDSQPVSQTASDYIATQLRLEEDAREVLPYSFNTCTKQLGSLRQSVYACLTCSPPPASPHQQHTPAGICYSCSVACHGEHTLVELFTKRNFECDCGTTRLATSGTPCSLRHNEATGRKGGVTGERAAEVNRYNHNFEGKFCGCGEEYDPEREKGTMFQCLGLGTVEEGGCGEDWWHPECLMGLPRRKAEDVVEMKGTNGALETVREEAETADESVVPKVESNGPLGTVHEEIATGEEAVPDEEQAEEPLPAGFPAEDDFDHLICYKCADAFPWIKQYAGTPGFLPAVSADGTRHANGIAASTEESTTAPVKESATAPVEAGQSTKRKASDDDDGTAEQPDSKKVKAAAAAPPADNTTAPATNGHHTSTLAPPSANNTINPDQPRHASLPPPPTGRICLFLQDDFRDHLCRCSSCFPQLSKHRQLLEEEESYEPPLSESSAHSAGGSVTGRSVNSGSLLERGEAALSSMDRVRAIEGVMAYNHVKDKVKAFLAPFAESGTPVGAEEIRAYFAKLRGDEQAQREAAAGAQVAGGAPGGGGGGQGAY